MVNTKLPAILSHRRSTTVSLEAYPFIHKVFLNYRTPFKYLVLFFASLKKWNTMLRWGVTLNVFSCFPSRDKPLYHEGYGFISTTSIFKWVLIHVSWVVKYSYIPTIAWVLFARKCITAWEIGWPLMSVEKCSIFFGSIKRATTTLNTSIFLWIPKPQNKEGGIWKATNSDIRGIN